MGGIAGPPRLPRRPRRACRSGRPRVDSSPHARGPSHRCPHARPHRAGPPPSRVDRNRRESTGIELHAEPPQSRLGPAPEPLPSRASLRTGKPDSCRFLSIRPLTHAAPHAAALMPALVAPSRPRVDSARPLSRCPRAPRSARANSTPVDSCRLLSIRPLAHAAPHARVPTRRRDASIRGPVTP